LHNAVLHDTPVARKTPRGGQCHVLQKINVDFGQ